jgi:hypothetical protein
MAAGPPRTDRTREHHPAAQDRCSGDLPVTRALARPDERQPARRRSPLLSLSPSQPGSISGVEAREETVPRFVIREGLGAAAAGVHSSTLW